MNERITLDLGFFRTDFYMSDEKEIQNLERENANTSRANTEEKKRKLAKTLGFFRTDFDISDNKEIQNLERENFNTSWDNTEDKKSEKRSISGLLRTDFDMRVKRKRGRELVERKHLNDMFLKSRDEKKIQTRQSFM